MTTNTRPRAWITADWVIMAWVWALLLAVVLLSRADPDLWGHLRFGLDWLATRSLSYVDPYSFTQDRPWINHEWLSEVQLALAYRAGGVTGLVALKIGLLVLTLIVLSGALARLPVLVRGGWMLLAVWSAVASITLTIRPQLWSWLLTVLVARLLLGAPSTFLLLALPVVFAFWMNVHGGVVVGLALLGTWTAYHVTLDRRKRRLALATMVAAVAATLANPYGFRLWQFIAETVRIGRDIQEWRPIWTAQAGGYAMPWAIATAAVVAMALSKARPRIDRLAIMLLLAYASARTMRLVPFFVVVSAIYLVPSLEALTRTGWVTWRLRAPSRLAAVLALVPLIPVAAVVHGPAWSSARRCLPIQGEWAPDLVVAAALRAADPQGRIVMPYGWGQYAIWHFGPELRVSFDGRLETVYTDATDLRQVAIERGEPEGIAFLAATAPEYIWLSHASAKTLEWVRNHRGYRIDLETPMSFLGVRADLSTIGLEGPVPQACFPG